LPLTLASVGRGSECTSDRSEPDIRVGPSDRAIGCSQGRPFAGQTTIPKDVRAAANLKPGDQIHFTVLEDGTIIVRVKNGSIRDISFRPPGAKRVSIARMNR
jgi:AbrB family looped-hinge helix DNA binding protein